VPRFLGQQDIVQAAMLRVVGVASRREHGGIEQRRIWEAACGATVDEIRRAASAPRCR
jgi:hypothetical protein